MTRNCGVAFHASRHEEAGVAMADGYARVSGKLGVCTVHQGPGVTNTLTALTEAVKGRQSVLVLGALLFTASLFFNALQPMSQALTADLVPSAAYLGAAFGLWNLIGEMGAVLSPAISGTLRDATGNWTAAIMLDAGIILVSFVLLLFVREPREEVEGAAPAGTRPEPG
jgi:MFS-type transporter involved in bile tolerance (Atg22 family)